MYQSTMYNKSKVKTILIVVAYFLLTGLSLAMLIIFKPFTFVNNDKSKIVCSDGYSYEAGPNYVYTLEHTLDAFNDKKARKLCAFRIIRDYKDSFKTPPKNYEFKPVYAQNSSWGDALLMTLVSFSLGVILIEYSKRHFLLTPLFLASSFFLVFFLYIQKNAIKIYCQRQMAEKVVNFRNSAYKSGVIAVPEENAHINKSLPFLYEKCLTFS